MCKIIIAAIFFLSAESWANDPHQELVRNLDQLRSQLERLHFDSSSKKSKELNLQLNKASDRDAEAMYTLYNYFYTGFVVPEKNYNKAFDWLVLAADHGHEEALIRLGEYYRAGNKKLSIIPDFEKSKHCFKKAADMGNTTAKFYYEDLLACGMSGTEGPDC